MAYCFTSDGRSVCIPSDVRSISYRNYTNMNLNIVHHTVRLITPDHVSQIKTKEFDSECPKSKRHVTFGGKIKLSKNDFSNFHQKSSADLNSGAVVDKTNPD